jgi:putative GTP pyrophosphokinase
MSTYDQTTSNFVEGYKEYVERVLAPTRREVRTLFAQWKKPDYWSAVIERKSEGTASPSPMQRVHTRIKRVESVMDKIHRRPDVFPEGLSPECLRRMHDTLGVRVIIYFLCHMPLIDRELSRLSEQAEIIEISTEDKPKAYLSHELVTRLALLHLDQKTKESGYASIHYILRLKKSTVPLEERPWFELQVRTLTEDIWGEIEHVLGYKPNKGTTSSVQQQFRIISKSLGAIDEHFNHLYEELTRFQGNTDYNEADKLNAENLPPTLALAGLGCAQREVDGILKLLVSRKIETVGALRSLSTPTRLEIIRNTYNLVVGRPPNNFEAIATLAHLVGTTSEAEQIDRIKEWIALFNVWDDLKGRGLV